MMKNPNGERRFDTVKRDLARIDVTLNSNMVTNSKTEINGEGL